MKVHHCGVPILALLCLFAAPIESRAQIPLEEIAVSLLSDRFGVDPAQVLGFLDRSNMSVFDAAPYYSTSYHADDPVDDVWRLREQGLGWGQVAQRLGMHPGTFNKLRKSGAFDRDAIWDSICEDRYGVRESDLEGIRRRGGSIRDAVPASIIAKASRNSPLTVYQRYRTVRDWNRTASYYKTDLRSHRKYAQTNVKPSKNVARVSTSRIKPKAPVHARSHKSSVRSKTSAKAVGRAKVQMKRSGRSSAKQTSTAGGRSVNNGRSPSKANGRGKARR